MTLQWNLIRLRKEHKLSQKDMANILGITQDSYGAKERGKQQFLHDEMFKIKHFFNRTIDEIFLPRNFGDSEVS